MNIPRRWLSVAALASMCLTFGSLPAAYATETEELPEIQDSSELTTQPVASGVMKDDAGNPVGEGELVVLYAWPNNEFLANLAVGESAKLLPVAKARTGAGGRFDMRIGNPGMLDPVKSSGGQVELSLSAETEGKSYTYNFARKMENTSSGTFFKDPMAPAWNPPPKDTGSTTPVTDGTGGEDGTTTPAPTTNATQTVTVDLAPIEDGSVSTTETAAEAPTQEAGTYSDKACFLYKQQTYAPSWVTVGQSFVATTGVTSDFGYNVGSNSSLGIGVSASGAYGSWSRSGTTALSASVGVDYAPQGAYTYKRMRTQFQYARFLHTCSWNGLETSRQYQVRPVAFVSGASMVNHGGAPAANYCASFAAGSTFTKTSTSAINWSTGAELGSTIGVNLSSQTGYSSGAKAYFKFSSARRLCGSHGYPGGTPVFLVAK
ncbi:hypothetical protein D6T65_15735 [Arthrobacter frigidicola]|nr:hypothetical protein D6T65_15735 [Arthrobacter frigidicola]